MRGKRQELPDHIRPQLNILFVGINPGRRSAAVGHHFAGHSNRLWKLLFDSRLVPVRLTYQDDWRLPEWGFGLTNLVARSSRGINALRSTDYAAGRRRLLAKVGRYLPRVVALLGVTLYSKVLLKKTGPGSPRRPGGAKVRLGLQRERLGLAKVFLLPNPSGRNAHYSYRQMLQTFRRLKKVAGQVSGQRAGVA